LRLVGLRILADDVGDVGGIDVFLGARARNPFAIDEILV
jgi:hypothetical protein